MLIISKEKIRQLEKQLRFPDKKWIKKQLQEMFTDLPIEEIEKFIEIGFEKTVKYGIDEDFPVRDFIALMIVAAQDFDQYPPVQAQLSREEIEPNLKVQLICELLTPAEWQEAKTFGTRAGDREKEDYVQKNIYGILYAASLS